MSYLGIARVVSGGQTGADQGGLMAAWDRSVPTGGWAPYDYRTNTGPNPLLQVLGLRTTDAKSYQARTCRNVEEADVTLVFGFDLTSAGSKQTLNYAAELGRPCFRFEHPIGRDREAREMRLIEEAVTFIMQHQPVVVNVAGNRDTDANNANFTTTRRVFGMILDLTMERVGENRVIR